MRKDLERTIAFYDEHYAESTAHLNMQALYDRFEKYLPVGASVLDAGCGSGRDSKYFLEKGYRVTSFDASELMCEYASKLIGKEVRKLTIQEMDYQDCFDGIWACASLLHIPEVELEDVLQKIATALKPGGVLYASWKHGITEHIDKSTGRFFCDRSIEQIDYLINRNQTLRKLDLWFTFDIRLEQREQEWINIIAQKQNDQLNEKYPIR